MLVLRNPRYRTRTYTLYKSVTMRKKSSSFRRKTKVGSPRINSENRRSAICGQLKFVKSSGPSVEVAMCGFAIFENNSFLWFADLQCADLPYTFCRLQSYTKNLSSNKCKMLWSKFVAGNQYYCGSGSASVCFWASQIRTWILLSQVRIRILPSSSKNCKKDLISTVLCLFYDFLSLKIWCKWASVPDPYVLHESYLKYCPFKNTGTYWPYLS